MIAAVIGGIGTAIQMPAAQAAVPELVDHDQLDRANGLGQIGPAGGIVLAPVIATMLVSRWGITAVLLVDAVTFVVAVIVTALDPVRLTVADITRTRPRAIGAASNRTRPRGWAPVFDWMRTSGRGIATLMAMAATVNLCLGFFNVALVAVVATIDERWAGLPLAVGGISMLGAGSRHRPTRTLRTARTRHHPRRLHALQPVVRSVAFVRHSASWRSARRSPSRRYRS